MKPLNRTIQGGRIQSLNPPFWSVTLSALLWALPWVSRAEGTVTNCTEASLRAAMQGGGTVTFACDGTITLGNTITNSLNTVLDASGHQITISGNRAVRVFWNDPTASLTLINLTVADGNSLIGSAILNLGTLNLTAVSAYSNTATMYAADGVGPRASGGAILNRGGNINATNCSFAHNRAESMTEISTIRVPEVCGGAIRNEAGHVMLHACAFVGNQASGGAVMFTASGANGDPAFGGAIHNSGTLTVDRCTFISNSVSGGSFPSYPQWERFYGSEGSGGAIFNQGILTVDRTTFSGNTATGGNGGWGGADLVSMEGLPGGGGRNAYGGAICNLGVLSVVRSTMASNIVTGGNGGVGGNGSGFMDMGGNGGRGGGAGSGLGGALFSSGTAILVNCTVAFNRGNGGAGGRGGAGAGLRFPCGVGGDGGNGGSGLGGVTGTCNLTNCTVASNLGIAGLGGMGGPPSPGRPLEQGAPGTNGSAWGTTSCDTMLNTLIASNTPAAGDDSFTNPKLGPLTDNGGPTPTMALLPGSPAIDAGTNLGAPFTDQRGVPRPQGARVDVGAYEFEFSPQIIGARFQPPSAFWLKCCGLPNQTYTLQTSTDLATWADTTNICTGSNGWCEYLDGNLGNFSTRFYRLKFNYLSIVESLKVEFHDNDIPWRERGKP